MIWASDTVTIRSVKAAHQKQRGNLFLGIVLIHIATSLDELGKIQAYAINTTIAHKLSP